MKKLVKMDKCFTLLVGLAFGVPLLHVLADGHNNDFTYVKLPNEKILMPLSEFEYHKPRIRDKINKNETIDYMARESSFLEFLPDVIADGQTKDIHYVKLPNDKLLMTLSEFELHIVDRQMGEMYFAIVKPPAFAPDINYKSTINKVSGSPNYTQITIGETPVVNSQCASGNTHLSPVGRDRALFYRGNNVRSVQAMWSSNPSRYIWSMRCENYFPGKRLCLLSESNFGVYVHGGLDDIPLSLHEDLCKATGLSFGDEKFKWFFSYGENTLC